jgi:carbohydrate binding protein with CBM35 domain
VAGGVGTIMILAALTIGPLSGFAPPWSGSTDASTVDGVGVEGPGLAATHSDPASAPTDSQAPGSSIGGSTDSSSGHSSSASSSSGNADSGGIPAPPPPPAVTVEAEAASVVRGGSATVSADPTASGGAYVSGVGNWGGGSTGSLVFTDVNLPSSGNWQLTIWFLDPGAKGPRHATVVVSGAAPADLLFAGWPTCCGTRTVEANLTAGTHTVVISNPDDVAPCIDRISFTLLP